MVTNYSQRLWLETAMVNECWTILSSTDTNWFGWISKLVFKNHTAVEAQTQSVIFRLKDFIPVLTSHHITIILVNVLSLLEGLTTSMHLLSTHSRTLSSTGLAIWLTVWNAILLHCLCPSMLSSFCIAYWRSLRCLPKPMSDGLWQMH